MTKIKKKDFPKKYEKDIEDFTQSLPYSLDNFQKHAIHSTFLDEHVLVTAHTGSGKTVIAEYAIKSAIKKNKKVLYTSPIKSLSNQKFYEFTHKYPDISVGILTGDIKFNPDGDCLIMTTEILRNLLFKNKGNHQVLDETLSLNLNLNDVDCVIFDEVHYINDKDRGKVWEECFILLPEHIKLVMLSATIDNANEFAEWIEKIKNRTVSITPTTHRVIPLHHYIYHNFKYQKQLSDPNLQSLTNNFSGKMIKILDPKTGFNGDNFSQMQQLLKLDDKLKKKAFIHPRSYLDPFIQFLNRKNLMPAIFFIFSRKKCEEFAYGSSEYLNDANEQKEVEKCIDHHIRKLENPEYYFNLEQYHSIKQLLVKGIAVHHSGLIPVFKEIIEILFSKHLIKLLFATETFAVGVNMPTKTVIFGGLSKFDGHKGHRLLETHEYLQMSGRAGRRGLDNKGKVILLSNMFDMPSYHNLTQMMTGRTQKIYSKFSLNFQFLLKAILSSSKDDSIKPNPNSNSAPDPNNNLQCSDKTNNPIIEYASSSFLQSQTLDRIVGLKIQLEEIKKDPPENTQISDDIFDEYYYLVDVEQPYKYTGKLLKERKNRISEIESLPNFSDEYNIYLKNYSKKSEYNRLAYSIEYEENLLKTEMEKSLSFLYKFNYVTQTEVDTLAPECLTPKGVIASQINECNEILLTEIITKDMLDDLNPEELVAVLSIFTTTKSSDMDEDISKVDNLEINKKVKKCLSQIEELAIEFFEEEEKFELEIKSDWELNLNMVTIAYNWAKGHSLNDIELHNFEGNFIKDIIRIDSIAQNIETLGKLVNKIELSETASKVKSLIMRDIVNVDSLYIKN